MSALAPVGGDTPELSGSLDDLLPSGAPEEPRPTPDPEPPVAAAPMAVPNRPPTQDEIDEIELLHLEVTRASEACESSAFGGRGRKQLRAALKAEDKALRQLGFSSHAAYVFATRSGTAFPAGRESIAASSAPAAPTAPEAPTEPAPTPPEAPAPEPPAPEPPVAETSAPKTEAPAPVEAAVSHVDSAALEAAEALAVQLSNQRQELDRARAELTERSARQEQADHDLDAARRSLIATQDELGWIRAELADVAAAREASDAAGAVAQAELEAHAPRVLQAEAAATAVRAELEQVRAELDQTRGELEQAHAARTAAEAERAQDHAARSELAAVVAELERSRAVLADAEAARAAGDEAQLRAHAELDAARTDLAEARAEIERVQSRSGVETEDLTAQLEAIRVEAARVAEETEEQHRAEIEQLAADLQESHDVGARATAEANDAIRSRDAAIDAVANEHTELEAVRAELGTARAELVRRQDDLERALADAGDVEAAHQEATRLDAELQRARADLGVARARVQQLESELEQTVEAAVTTAIEAAPVVMPDDGEPARLGDLARARLEAERELSDLDERVARLRAKRRKLKRRIARQRIQLDAERASLEREIGWARDETTRRLQIAQEVDALAARIPPVAADIDDIVRVQQETRRAVEGSVEQAAVELALLERHVEAVTSDADALRSKLATIRAGLSRNPDPDLDRATTEVTDPDRA